MPDLHNLIGADTVGILWWQMCIRASLIFVFGLILVRLFGRRAFGQQSALDIVLAIIFGSSLSRALTANAPFVPTLAAMTLLVICFWILEQLAARFRAFGRFVKGKPIPLVRDGRLDKERMKRAGISKSDVAEAARQSGFEDVDDVRAAALERSGRISTLGQDEDGSSE